jgi:hypothetical protein
MSSDQTLTNFVGLSSVLTGYSKDKLAPAIDPIGLASEYLGVLERKTDSQILLQTLAIYQNIAQQAAAQFPNDPLQQAQLETQLVGQQILPNLDMGNLCRRIIRLWYLSTYYTTEPPDPNQDGEVVSMNAYTMGLAWDAFQAHPMGYSEMHFGYWATPPETNDSNDNS